MGIEKDLMSEVVSKNNLAKNGNTYQGTRRSYNYKGLKTSGFLLACLLVVLPSISIAAPTGGNIAGGSGSISQAGSTTNIYQNSNSLAINWNSFNVNKNETVNFLQPGASSIALNRILSQSGSQILGQINANGHVVLVNPSGILL